MVVCKRVKAEGANIKTAIRIERMGMLLPHFNRKAIALIALLLILFLNRSTLLKYINNLEIEDFIVSEPCCEVPLRISSHDENQNKVPDALDFVAGARQEVERHTRYDGSYYNEGYPPEGKGACTDVIWRSFRQGGYDLRAMVDEDIRLAPGEYGATGQQPDSCIDYRRVQNLQVFFQRYGQVLTNEIKPGDKANLTNWQPGDIVVFAAPKEHIAIISDQRRPDGVPLIIHNAGPWASEADYLQSWPSPIIYHFRFNQ